MVIAAAALWGSTGTAQSLLPAGLSSVWVGTLRLVIASLFFGLLFAASGRPSRGSLRWRGVVVGAACMTVYNFAFFGGVRATGVAVGTAIALGSGPIWAGLLEAALLRRVPSRVWWLGTMAAVCGATLMLAGPGNERLAGVSGIGLCLLAGLSYAGYALISKSLVADTAPGTVTAAVFMLAAMLALPAAFALAGLPTVRAADLPVFLWLGVLSTGVAYLLFGHALMRVSGATAVALALFEPVTAFGLAIVVIGERPGLIAFVGLGVVLIGLWIVARAELASADPVERRELH